MLPTQLSILLFFNILKYMKIRRDHFTANNLLSYLTKILENSVICAFFLNFFKEKSSKTNETGIDEVKIILFIK